MTNFCTRFFAMAYCNLFILGCIQRAMTSTYHWDSTRRSWEDSKQYCKESGGQLLVIHSEAEYQAVVVFLNTLSVYEEVWIGLRLPESSSNQNDFQWVDDSRSHYTRWGQCISQLDVKKCVALRMDKYDKDYASKQCTKKYSCICGALDTVSEYPVRSVRNFMQRNMYFSKLLEDNSTSKLHFEAQVMSSLMECAVSCVARLQCSEFTFGDHYCRLFDSSTVSTGLCDKENCVAYGMFIEGSP